MDINTEECRRLERHSMDLTNACRKLKDLSIILDAIDENSIVAVRLYKSEHDSSGGYYLSSVSKAMQSAMRAEVTSSMRALEYEIKDLRKRLA